MRQKLQITTVKNFETYLRNISTCKTKNKYEKKYHDNKILMLV